ncbi:MAG: carbamoyltransferase HypF [Pirellulaceae bacterium]|nr:carbamoyltransferase HypF [Pirellulaceae bacterium]
MIEDRHYSCDSASRRLAITARGVVQGVGFRPFVYNAARSNGLTGWVRNESGAVRIEVQGGRAAIDAFLDQLRNSPPPQARIDSLDVADIPPEELDAAASFEIRASGDDASPQPTIPADLATCAECLAEINTPGERRHGYPFTNCTNCGPRLSIIERLPYDRPNTSMSAFEMCAACRAEYENPADRRFHAQPIACPTCGPRLQLLNANGVEKAVGPAALTAAVEALLAGRIVALKGLGGFQLLADATNAEAVARLRERKHRPDRPFALMMASLDEVRRYCRVSDGEAQLLVSHQAPIVLLRRKILDDCSPDQPAAEATAPLPSPLSSLPSSIAPGNPYLGVMLPYTPLHHLLMQSVERPIICTSGNLSEEPMAIDTEDALRRLGSIADVLLTHDRPIVRPVDDSIVRVGIAGVQVLRRARGFAPLPIEIQTGDWSIFRREDVFGDKNIGRKHGPVPLTHPVLAVGGHLKNTVALTLGGVRETRHEKVKTILSAHIGDLESTASIGVFRRAIDDLLEFYKTTPKIVACDLHPDYASTRHAEELAARWDVPLVRVQHHHAHVAACMAEHGLQGPVLGFAWDGTGYGPDGTVWGGEVLLCEGAEYHRAAHLRTFALPGGDRAAREPRRSALGLLYEIFGSKATEYAKDMFAPQELENLLLMLDRKINSPRTSSMGRLFDAVAALVGLPPVITFEGQSAMALEFAADENEQCSYVFSLTESKNVGGDSSHRLLDGQPQPSATGVASYNHSAAHVQPGLPRHDIDIDWEPLVRGVLADRAAGVPVAAISGRFHNTLADMAVAVAKMPEKPLPIVLSGGCFQNALLTERVNRRLSAEGFSVYNHHKTPPGDGCIALGQAAVALHGS